jgi:hypothetical protein
MRLYELKPGRKKEFHPSNTEEPQSFTTFLANCSESIAAMREAKSFLYRGTYGAHDIFLGRPRENRKTTDTSPTLQKEWDKIYTSAGFTALRSNSIFCSADIHVADSYGHSYIIFPINGFSFTWSPKIYDLYNHMQQHDINRPADLYVNPDAKKKIDSIADKIYTNLRYPPGSTYGELEDDLYSLSYLFQDIIIVDDYSIKGPAKLLQKIIASTAKIEKKHKINLDKVHVAIKEIHALLNSSIMSPETVIEKYQYSNQDFPAALKSKKEIIVNGEYYAFMNKIYFKYLWDALITK